MALNLLVRSLLSTTNRSGSSMIASSGPKILGGYLYQDSVSQGALFNYVQNRGAARRGKRIERTRLARLAAAKRRLLEAQNPKPKKTFKSSIKIDKTQFRFQTERQLDTKLPNPPADNVYFTEKYRKPRFSINEIIDFHKQVVHQDVLNVPDALVTAVIELNLKMKIKKKRFIEKIESTVCFPHVFKYEIRPRKIIALCKDQKDQDAAKEAGAFAVGALDIVDQLKKSQLTQRDFDHIVCHNDFLVDFAAVKGMKGSGFFPSKARGNFGDDMAELVRYFKDGIDYTLKKSPEDPEYGFIECHFGKLDMTHDQLRENLVTLLNSVNRFKPLNLDEGKQFFERISITTPATSESFFLKFWKLMDEYEDPDAKKEDSDEENQQTANA